MRRFVGFIDPSTDPVHVVPQKLLSRQPGLFARIDHKSEFSKGAICVVNGAFPTRDAATGASMTVGGSPAQSKTPYGVGPRVNNSNYIGRYVTSEFSQTDSWVIACILMPTGTYSSNNTIVGIADSPGGSSYDRQILRSGLGAYWEVMSWNYGTTYANVQKPIVEANRAEIIVGTSNGTHMWMHTRKGSSQVSAPNVGWNGFGSMFFGIGASSSAAASVYTVVPLVIFAQDFWGPDKARRWIRDPWQIFE